MKSKKLIPMKSSDNGVLSGGFAVLDSNKMSHMKGGDRNNDVCSSNATCNNNGTCSGNSGRCVGNGYCVNLQPIGNEPPTLE
jgi:hypothetical protein